MDDKPITVRRRKLAEYRPDPRNANRGTERGQYMLDHSVEQVGAARSIVAANDDTIPIGNHALQAFADAGLEDVIEIEVDGKTPVVVKRTDWASTDDPQVRRAAYLDNRSSEVGLDWDAAVIVEDMADGHNLDDLWFPHEMEEIRQENEINSGDLPDVDRLDGSQSARLIKVALYGDGVALLEQAILATGERNRAEALKEICRVYLNEKRQLDF